MLFCGSSEAAGPKHSTSVPFRAGSAVPLSVDVKEGPFEPKPVPNVAVKALPGPQIDDTVDLCSRGHSLFPPTLQMVTPLMSPVTVHLKVKVSSGQFGGAAINCPVTLPAWRPDSVVTHYLCTVQFTWFLENI